MDASKTPPCPACGSDRVAWILFGFPDFTDELEAALDAGRVVLGGCCIDVNDPEWQCQACGHEWGQSKLVATLQNLTREAEQRPKSWWQLFLMLFGLTFIEESVFDGFVRRFIFMGIGAGLVLNRTTRMAKRGVIGVVRK